MLKLISEFGPLVAFFIGYKTGGILEATLFMVVASFVGLVLVYIKDRTINKVNLISSVILLASASLTLFSGNSIFIKMKPTILYLIFSCIFLVTTLRQNPAIRYVLGHAIKFKDESSWSKLNVRFMWFFLFMALLNEVIWRNFDEASWVNFKVFGALPITILFIMMQVPFILKKQTADSAH
jgi:intracellular septation protein